jgi:hypothetical protein
MNDGNGIAIWSMNTPHQAHLPPLPMPHHVPMSASVRVRRRIKIGAAAAAEKAKTAPPTSPACACGYFLCRRRCRCTTLRIHSIVNNATIFIIIVSTIVFFNCASQVLAWTISAPTRRHDNHARNNIQPAIIRSFHYSPPVSSPSSITVVGLSPLSTMASNDDNETTNISEVNDGSSNNLGIEVEEVENEAEIMDIADALILTSSPPIEVIDDDDEQSRDINGNTGTDVVDAFMYRANAAWNDGLSSKEGNTDLGTNGSGADVKSSTSEESVVETKEDAPTSDLPYFTTLPNSNEGDDVNISNGDVDSSSVQNKLQPLNTIVSNSNVAILKGATTTTTPTIPAQPWKSSLKGIPGKGFPQPPSKMSIDSNSSGSTMESGRTLIGKTSTLPPASTVSDSPLKSVTVGSATQSTNMLGPMKKSFAPLNKGTIGEMKAKTAPSTFPLPKMVGLKKGSGLGELTSTSSVTFPPPLQTLKGALLSESNVGKVSSFNPQSLNPEKTRQLSTPEGGGSSVNKSPLPKIGQINKQIGVGTAKSGGVGGGTTLPFMKKSPFTTSPSKSLDIMSSFSAKGKGDLPSPLKGNGGSPIGKGFIPPPLKSPINDGAPRLTSVKDSTMASPPFQTGPLKGVVLFGTAKSSDMLGPSKKSPGSINLGGAGGLKDQSGTAGVPLKDSNGLSKGMVVGQLKSMSAPFPASPQALKGTQTPSGSSIDQESSFAPQSFKPGKETTSPTDEISNLRIPQPLPQIGQINKQVLDDTAKSRGVGGGTLPFMKKSPFTASPSKGIKGTSFGEKGIGDFPKQLKGNVGSPIGKGFIPPPLKSPINGDAPRSTMKDSTAPFQKGPLKGVVFGAAKSSDMLGPSQTLGGAGGLKDQSDTAGVPLKDANGLSKGMVGGQLKSKSTPFPASPQALKGTQTPSGSSIDQEFSFNKQSFDPDEASFTPPDEISDLSNPSPLPQIGQINKQVLDGTAQSGGVGGGALPFMKKSPFTASPSKGIKGTFSSSPIGKGFIPLKSPISGDAPRLEELNASSDNAMKDTTTTLPTSVISPLKGSDFGAGKSSDILGPLSKGLEPQGKGVVAGMKAKTGIKSFPMPTASGMKQGPVFPDLKSKSASFPTPPQTLKGKQSDAKPKISQIDKRIVGTGKSGVVGGGTLPFMKKSPFTSSPSKSVEISSFNSTGRGIVPTQLKVSSPSPLMSPIIDNAPRDDDLSTDDTTASSSTIQAPLTGIEFGNIKVSDEIGENSFESSKEDTQENTIIEANAVDSDLIEQDRDEGMDGDVIEAVVEDFEDDRNIIAPISFSRASEVSSVDARIPPPKVMGTGRSFTPKAFTPPKARPMPKTLDIVDGFIDLDSWKDEGNPVTESGRQAKQPKNIWTGESFYGTASSRVYGLGADNIDVRKRSDMKAPLREEKEPTTAQSNTEDVDHDKNLEEMNLLRGKENVSLLLADAERKIAEQMQRIEEERKETKAILESTAREKAAFEKRASKLEATLMNDVRFLERRLADEVSLAKLKLKEEQDRRDADRERLRAVDEARWNERFINEDKLGGTTNNEDELLEKFNLLLESKLEERLAELRKDRNNQAQSSVSQSLKADDAVKIQIPSSEPNSVGASNHFSDSLATDINQLDIVSMSFDQKRSTQLASLSLDESAEIRLNPTEYPFVSLLRDSSPYIVNHRRSTIVYHIPGDLISNQARFNSVMDDISLTYLFGMKIVICVGCRKQILQRLENLPGRNAVGVDQYSKVGVRVTDAETLRIVEEEAGFCRFEVERLLNRCLRNKGADCNVVSGCFITAKKYGIIGGVDYQVRQVSFGTSSNWKLSHAYNSPVAHWVPDDVADRSNKQFPFKK